MTNLEMHEALAAAVRAELQKWPLDDLERWLQGFDSKRQGDNAAWHIGWDIIRDARDAYAQGAF